MLHICKQQNCSSIIKRRFKIGKKPLRFVVEIELFFCAFMLYSAEIIYVLFPSQMSTSLHFVTFYPIYKETIMLEAVH